MTLALRSPELVRDVVAVDNAPLDAAIESQFARYVQGMKKINEAGVTRQADADKILQDYEEVGPPSPPAKHRPSDPSRSHWRFGSSSWATSSGRTAAGRCGSACR